LPSISSVISRQSSSFHPQRSARQRASTPGQHSNGNSKSNTNTNTNTKTNTNSKSNSNPQQRYKNVNITQMFII
jgi:hypothetical protein